MKICLNCVRNSINSHSPFPVVVILWYSVLRKYPPCVNIFWIDSEWMFRLLHCMLKLGSGLQQHVRLVPTNNLCWCRWWWWGWCWCWWCLSKDSMFVWFLQNGDGHQADSDNDNQGAMLPRTKLLTYFCPIPMKALISSWWCLSVGRRGGGRRPSGWQGSHGPWWRSRWSSWRWWWCWWSWWWLWSRQGKGHLVPVDGDGDGQHQEDGDAGQSDGDDENLSAISLRASPRTLSDWCREASALK